MRSLIVIASNNRIYTRMIMQRFGQLGVEAEFVQVSSSADLVAQMKRGPSLIIVDFNMFVGKGEMIWHREIRKISRDVTLVMFAPDFALDVPVGIASVDVNSHVVPFGGEPDIMNLVDTTLEYMK